MRATTVVDVELHVRRRDGRRARDVARGLAVREGRRWSASHTGELLVVALAEVDLGVDVERVRPRPRTLTTRLHPQEAAALAGSPGGPPFHRALTELWTAKEAVLKARGTGLAGGLRSFAVVDGRVTHTDDGPWALAAFALRDETGEEVPGCVAVRAPGPVALRWARAAP